MVPKMSARYIDPARFRLTHQTSFVKRHSGMSNTPGVRWIVAFFRLFLGSVTKVDYLTMRHGFINAHLAPNSKFDFHKYIKRSMEDDFKVVLGVSIPLWIFAVIFLLLDVYGWYTLLWISFVPLIILLLVGVKLEMIIMEMAQQIQDKTAVVKGAPLVEPSNELFWFKRPQDLSGLSFHNIPLQYEFGLKSCFHEKLPAILARELMGLALQFLCSYITFPLYSLVTQVSESFHLLLFLHELKILPDLKTQLRELVSYMMLACFQMGSHMKKAIFEEQTAKALMKWKKAATERRKQRKAAGGDVSPGYMSGDATPSHSASSPIPFLHKHKVRSTDMESMPGSPRSYISDDNMSDMEAPTLTPPRNDYHTDLYPRHGILPRDHEDQSADFSFVKP
ncbi:hypothetical protein ACLOJK_018368 [Asimina triloba]